MTRHSARLVRTSELGDKDLRAISQVYKDSFGDNVSTGLLRRKYSSSLGGSSWHGLMFSERKLVGVYTFTARSVTLEGREIVFLQSVDTSFPYKCVVSPFAIKSLALKLLGKAMEEYKNSVPVFVCGFPNDKYEAFSRRIFNWHKSSLLRFDICMLPIIQILKAAQNAAARSSSERILSWRDNTPIFRVTSRRIMANISIGHSVWDVDLLKKPLPVLIFRCRAYAKLASIEDTSSPLLLNRINSAIKTGIFLVLSIFPALMPSISNLKPKKGNAALVDKKRSFNVREFHFYLAALNQSAKKCSVIVEQIPVAFMNDVP
jgi:hypothetical protein